MGDATGSDPVVLPEVLTLPSGQRLLVRDVESTDVEALEQLYARLDDEARYRRFFSMVRPDREFFERLVAVGDRGGCAVVVVDLDAPSDSAIIAEADAMRSARDHDGDAEVAMTIDHRWRGWLGPFLLDVLCARAAQQGIQNLRADILSCNRPMHALTRHRGEAYLPDSDWQTVSVVFSTSGRAPSWGSPADSSGRPKALVEVRSLSFDSLAELAAAGFDVRACTGRRAGAPPCPLVSGDGDCPLASGADVVVVDLPDGDERDRLLAAHRERHPDVPVVAVERSPGAPVRGAALISAAERGVIGSARRTSERG